MGDGCRGMIRAVCFCVSKVFFKNFKKNLIFSFLQINIFFIFPDHLDVLMSKIIFKE